MDAVRKPLIEYLARHRSVPWLAAGSGALCWCSVALTVVAACSSGGDASAGAVVRDSSGITIVENTDGVRGGLEGWAVSSEPITSVGAVDGDPNYQFFIVAGAARFPDGRIAVVDRGSANLRIYDSEGVFLRNHGRKGSGPGEFRSPALAGRLGEDTVVVVDNELKRLSTFHADSGFVSSRQISDEVGPAVSPRGMFPNGEIVTGGTYTWAEGQGDEVTGGYSRPLTSYRSFSLDGALATEFGDFPGAEFHINVRALSDGGASMSADLIPFSRHPVVCVGRTTLYVGLRDRWEVRAFGQKGALARIIRIDRDPLPIEEADLEALIQDRAGQDANEARRLRRQFAEMDIPKTQPALGVMAADALGYLWVAQRRREEGGAQVFDVIDPAGVLVGQVAMAAFGRVLEIGEDYVLMLQEDDLDVQSIRVFTLSRG